MPRTLDPARAADLPSLNVAHELYAGLTRFSGRGVQPDLAESWEHNADGSVWTFHLRKGLRWSDDRPIRAQDFRDSWLHALDPKTGSAYARAEMGNVRGARRYHATGRGEVGVEAVDDRTLRVTLEHPVPWLDEQVAWPVFFPRPPRASAFSGPFRLVSDSGGRLALERNFNYWNVAAVKPSRVVLTTSTRGVDGILPRNVAPPGFHWVQTARAPAGWRELPTLAIGLLWLVTRDTPLADPNAREFVYRSILQLQPKPGPLVPPAMPGAATVNEGSPRLRDFSTQPPPLTLAYTVAGRNGRAACSADPRPPRRGRRHGHVEAGPHADAARPPGGPAGRAGGRPRAARLELGVLRRVQHPRPVPVRERVQRRALVRSLLRPGDDASRPHARRRGALAARERARGEGRGRGAGDPALLAAPSTSC